MEPTQEPRLEPNDSFYRAGFQAGLNGHPKDLMYGDKTAQAKYDQGYYDGKAEYERWLSRK